MLGIALVDKPVGISSHDAIYALRRRFQIKRIGHAGTLDPLAQGLLVVAVGPATRFLQYLFLEPKVYTAQVKFGFGTTTYDAEGEPLGAFQTPPADLKSAINAEIPSFTGLIEQVPPIYSAIKINGQPAYKSARAGMDLELQSRRVFIEKISLLDCGDSECRLEVICSGGTYIRSFAHDLGRKLGCGAHLIGLIRTQIGPYRLADAQALDSIAVENLIPLTEALSHLPSLDLEPDLEKKVQVGQKISSNDAIEDQSKVVLKSKDGNFIGIGRQECGELHPECILPA